MRNTLIAVALVLAASAISRPASAQTAAAYYNYVTGNIRLEGVYLVGAILLKGPNLDLDPAPDALGGFVDFSVPGEVAWLFFTAKNGSVDLGNLLPTNLTNANLNEYFVGAAIAGGHYEPYRLSIITIPEPASLSMAALGVVGCLAMRRRASCRRC